MLLFVIAVPVFLAGGHQCGRPSQPGTDWFFTGWNWALFAAWLVLLISAHMWVAVGGRNKRKRQTWSAIVKDKVGDIR